MKNENSICIIFSDGLCSNHVLMYNVYDFVYQIIWCVRKFNCTNTYVTYVHTYNTKIKNVKH